MSDSMKGLEELLGENSLIVTQIGMTSTLLRRKQLTGSWVCAKTTVDILRSMLGNTKNLQTKKNMIDAVRLVETELSTSATSEFTVSNIARRVIQIIEEEYSTKMSDALGQNKDQKKSNEDTLLPEESRSRASSIVEKILATPNSKSIFDDGSFPENTLPDDSHISHLNSVSSSLAEKIPSDTPFSKKFSVGNGVLPTSNVSMKGSSTRYKDHQQPSLGSFPENTLPDDSHISHLNSVSSSLAEKNPSDTPFSKKYSVGNGVLPTSNVSMKGSSTEYKNHQQPSENTESDLRQSVLGAVDELNEEIMNIYVPICSQAQEHIHAEECILTYGWSKVVEEFLIAGGRKRKFQVIVAEAAPELGGHKLALALSKSNNITITLVPDSAVFAIMGTVNKVLLAPHAVLADGGGTYSAGHLMVVVAAKEHNVPVIAVTATYNLTPMFAHDKSETLGQLLSPSLTIPYNAGICQENVEVVNPAFDLIPPELISLYVTNNGTHQPSYIHRVLAELYPRDDVAHSCSKDS